MIIIILYVPSANVLIYSWNESIEAWNPIQVDPEFISNFIEI